ncbi:right-handed parallel beta-helix repeat-containing protein [Methanobrevibacter curvatus]|uniref:DUF11 domain-containing protein n=1 Tax=Methanobrevibacter curvatus TaxID=49547 RepID=A0A166B4C2_9EURY|nr:right-handed parallel beta-helix repeat-containing protein [Methanobrevibacter curvatus]KZX12842.1 hypothetical protein MBCUR_08980 [Methanobrevibacter curvatus]
MFKSKKSLFMLVLLISIFVLASSTAFAANHTVSNTNTVAEIQSVIDSATLGDTVNFNPGNYANLVLNVNKSITLNGNGANINTNNGTKTVFTASGTEPTTYKDITIKNFVINEADISSGNIISFTGGVDNLVLDQITITGDNLNFGTGINLRGATNVVISNSDISGVRDAIGVGGGSKYTIVGNNFHDTGRNSMSFFQDANTFVVANNTLSNAQFGIFYGGGVKYVDIVNNTITGFNLGLGFVKAVGDTNVVGNTLTNNDIAIEVKAGDEAHGYATLAQNLTIVNNVIQNNTKFGIYLFNLAEGQVGTDIVIDSNDFANNGIGLKDEFNWSSSDWTQAFDSYGLDIVKNYFQAPDENGTVENQTANITISSKVNVTSVTVGQKVVYSITVKNTGNVASDAITVNAGIPSTYGTAVAQYIADNSAYSKGTWTIDSLGAGDTAVLVLEVTTKKAGTAKITTTLSSSNNVSESVTKTLTIKDLKPAKISYTVKNKVKGKQLIRTYTIKNTGEKVGTASINLKIPNGYKYVKTVVGKYASYKYTAAKKSVALKVTKLPGAKYTTITVTVQKK